MTSRRSIVLSIVAAGITAASIAFAVTQLNTVLPAASVPAAQPPPPQRWTATAPGRVEPKGGEVRHSALVPGRIAEVAVRVNDRVQAGDLMVRLDDDEQRARLMAADAEVAVRKRDRDAENVNRLAQDRRNSEDAVAAAERNLISQRLELDRLVRLQRSASGNVTDEAVGAQRSVVAAAAEKVEQERATHRRNLAAAGIPTQTRLEASVTAARADAAVAELAWERARVRAHADGTVLQVLARAGELASASPEQALVVIGDLSMLRVRAEIEERDIPKVRPGQAVVVRSDAFPGREFTGRVATLAQSLSSARIPQRGPRRPTDQDTLEAIVDLDPGSPLLPGMRVDVLFRADETARGGTTATTK